MSTSFPATSIARQVPLSSSLPADDPMPRPAEPVLSSAPSMISQSRTPSLLQQAVPPHTASEPLAPARTDQPSLAPANVPALSAQSQVKQETVLPQQQGRNKGMEPDDLDEEDSGVEEKMDFGGERLAFGLPGGGRARSMAAQSDKWMARMIADSQHDPEIVEDFYKTLGKQLKENGEHQDALRYFRNALTYQKIRHDVAPDKTVKIHRLIVETLVEQSEYEQALFHLQEMVHIQRSISGVDHLDTADTYRQIGAVYGNLNDYSRALVYFRLALSVYRKELAIDDYRLAYVHNQIGIVLNDQGKVAEAVQHYQESLAALESKLGTRHPNLADLYHNYAVFLEKLGRVDMAQEYRRRERVIRQDHN